VSSLADRAASHRADQLDLSDFLSELVSALNGVSAQLEIAARGGPGDGASRAIADARLELERALNIFDRGRTNLLG
jgi:hypothetical protein